MVDGYSTSKPAAVQKTYIRCRPCRAKFPNTRVGSRELTEHQAECVTYILSVRKEKVSRLPKSKLSYIEPQPFWPSSAKESDNASVPPFEVDSRGYWIKECDLCRGKVNLGKSLSGNQLEIHRNSKICQKAQRRVQLQSIGLGEKDSEKNAGIQKYSTRSATQTSLDEAKPSSSSDRTRVESVPSSSSTLDTKKPSKSTQSKEELTPADANLMTLAYDVLRALTDLPAEKSSGSSERARKKIKC